MKKPFYRAKGKYKDGRTRIVIEDRKNNKSKALPKPEVLLKFLLKGLVNGHFDLSKNNKGKQKE